MIPRNHSSWSATRLPRESVPAYYNQTNFLCFRNNSSRITLSLSMLILVMICHYPLPMLARQLQLTPLYQARAPTKAPIHHWVYPNRPFERVHLDFAEYKGQHYLLIIDAYSKWADVFVMGKSTTTERTLSCLKRFISYCGIPLMLVSDNGPQFTSMEFATFCQKNGIRHKRTPPYHPASNGQVERLVQELKKHLAKSDDSPQDAVSQFLFSYRNTPHSVSHS
eukprot:scpid53836/ scgid23713/ Uncharacterized protein K02A2.6